LESRAHCAASGAIRALPGVPPIASAQDRRLGQRARSKSSPGLDGRPTRPGPAANANGWSALYTIRV